jgi:hypothetical protein
MPVKIEIRGNADLRKALRRFTPDLEKALRKELAAALMPVVKQAKGFVTSQSPMSGWDGGKGFGITKSTSMFRVGQFPLYNPTLIKAGITYSTTPSAINENGFSSMARIQNKSRVGAIYEGAGRANPQGQPWVGPKAESKSNKVSKSNNPKAGKQFIENLPPLVSSLKGRGRLIYRAWAANQGRAEGAAMKAIDKALTQFRVEAAKGKLRKAA